MARKNRRPDRAILGPREKVTVAPRRLASKTSGADCIPAGTTPCRHGPLAVLAVCGFLLLAVALVFAQTVRHEFINFDDDPYVYENFQILRGLTPEGLAGAFTHSHAHNWHPLTTISHMLDCQLYGLWAGGHHLTNVLLHAATSVVLFLVLCRMTGAFWPAAFAAAVFAIHPLRVESVAWVAERKDVLSGLFFTLTLAAYLGYARRPFSLARYLLVAACFACGLMAKPMLVTLPFLLLLLDYWPLRRLAAGWEDGEMRFPPRPLRILLAEKVPLVLLGGISCWLTLQAQGWAVQLNERVPLSLRLGNALTSYAAYLGQIFWPAGLALPYPYPVAGLAVGKVIASLGLLLGLSAGAILCLRKRPYLLVGWLWFLGTLLPVIGLMQTGDQAMADRYTYLTQIGLYVAIACLASDLTRAWLYRRPACGLAAAIVIATLMACAWRQTTFWRTSELLWTHTLACTRQNCPAHNNLGLAQERRGGIDEAIGNYRAALDINPHFPEAHVNLGVLLAARGERDQAIAHYQQALESNPRSVPAWSNLGLALREKGQIAEAIAACQRALELDPLYVNARNNLGGALCQQGRVAEGIEQFQRVLAVSPTDAEAYHNLGVAYDQQGRIDEAAPYYRKAIELNPRDVSSHYNLGVIDYRQGRVDDATAQYREVLKIEPRHVSAHVNLGGLLYQQEKTEEAMAHFAEAVKLDPQNGEAHGNLGSALSQQGRYAEALDQWRAAIRLQPNSPGTLNAAAQLLATTSEASLRNGSESLELARRAVDLTHGRDATILETLAAANAEAGRFDEAIRVAEQARALALAQNNQALAAVIAARLKFYRAGLPFHQAR